MQTEIIDFTLNKEIIVKPLHNKTGFNRHYFNLVNADVFRPVNISFFQKIKNFFSK